MTLQLNNTDLKELTDFLVESANAELRSDIYEQLKYYVYDVLQVDNERDIDEVLDWFMNNLHGSFTWSTSE